MTNAFLFSIIIIHYVDEEFVIHRKLLRRRHICKEKREKREESQRFQIKHKLELDDDVTSIGTKKMKLVETISCL